MRILETICRQGVQLIINSGFPRTIYKKYYAISIFGEILRESWQIHWIMLGLGGSFWQKVGPLVKCTECTVLTSDGESSITSLDSLAKYHNDTQPVPSKRWEAEMSSPGQAGEKRINLTPWHALLKHFIKIVTIYFSWWLHILMLHIYLIFHYPLWNNFPLLWSWGFFSRLAAGRGTCIGGSIFVIKPSGCRNVGRVMAG